jgi:hypothetical protein
MAVHGGTWQYKQNSITVHGGTWWYMALDFASRFTQYMAVHGGTWAGFEAILSRPGRVPRFSLQNSLADFGALLKALFACTIGGNCFKSSHAQTRLFILWQGRAVAFPEPDAG